MNNLPVSARLPSFIIGRSSFCPSTKKNLESHVRLPLHHSTTLNCSICCFGVLYSLAQDNSIVIKEADKGGGIVIMNTDFYKRKVLEMLTDDSYYQPVPDNNRREIFGKIDELIKSHKKLT